MTYFDTSTSNLHEVVIKMSSTTITVKPKRRSARSPPPSVSETTNSQGTTVLLRNPLPKYSFQVSKKPSSEQSSTSQSKSGTSENVEKNTNKQKGELKVTSSGLTNSVTDSNETKLAKLTVGDFQNSFPQSQSVLTESYHTGTVYSPSGGSTSQSALGTSNSGRENCVKEKTGSSKPVNVVDPVQNHGNAPEPPQPVDTANTVFGDSLVQDIVSSTNMSTVNVTNQTATSPSDMATACSQGADPVTAVGCDCTDQVKALQKENQYLKTQLDVQLQVNAELKKLLIASIGEDLHQRMESLTRDKAELSLEVGGYSKKVSEDYEHLDKLAIQADMWRSKYLASRVMADELASSKAFFSMQFQECQNALHQLLNERHELKANLSETYRCLQQVKGAFDPLNSDNSSTPSLASKHNLDLARANQQLADAIKYRLLPSHVTSSLNSSMEADWHDYLTRAEAHAQEILSREVRPEDFRHLVKPAIMAPAHMTLDRYNAFTRFDNLTINVCCKCKGDISVV